MSKASRKRAKAKPRKKSPARSVKKASKNRRELGERIFEPALCIIGEGSETIFGLTTSHRLKRQFAHAGVSAEISRDAAVSRNGPIIIVRGDAVIDQPLIPILAKRPNLMLVSDAAKDARPLAVCVHGSDTDEAIKILHGDGPPPDRLKLLVRSPGDLGAAFWKGLRKREVPYAGAVNVENRRTIEWRLFMGTYKGATDFVTKHIWPRPAFHVTRMLAATSATPNMVTTASAVCTMIAFGLFLNGHFMTGLAAAWLMTFLDTVDGKLARTTLTSSKSGNIFDHGIDLIHPPFWYAAWAYGVVVAGTGFSQQSPWLWLGIVIAGYILQRLMEGIAIKWLGLEIHIWRPIDTFFRQITARRNPNLALLTLFTVIARPAWGLMAVAVWTAVCVVLHGIQLGQAFSAKRATGTLESWMSAPVTPK